MGAFLWDLAILVVIGAVILWAVPGAISRPIIGAITGIVAFAWGKTSANMKAGKMVREAVSTSGMHTVNPDAPAATRTAAHASPEAMPDISARWHLLHRNIPEGAHVAVIAGTGAGKGQTAVIPTAYQTAAYRPQNMVILDPKGEVLRELESVGAVPEAYVYDFRRGQPTSSMNPVSDAESAAGFAEALYRNPHSKEPFWEMAAMNMFTALCAATGYRKGLGELYDTMGKPQELERIGERDDEFRAAYNDMPERTRGSVLGHARTPLAPLRIPQVRSIFDATEGTERPEFGPQQRDMVFVHPPAEAGAAAASRQLIGAVIDTLYAWSTEGHRRGGAGTYWLLDEAASVVTLANLENYLAVGRGLGQRIMFAIQDIAQLEARIGKEVARSALGNAEVQLWGRIQNADTARYLSETSGTVRVQHVDFRDGGPGMGRTFRQMRGDWRQGEDYVYAASDRAAVQPEHLIRQRQFTWFLIEPEGQQRGVIEEVEAEPWYAYRDELPRGYDTTAVLLGVPPIPASDTTTDAPPACPECGAGTAPGQRFCSECGAPQGQRRDHTKDERRAKVCGNCGTENEPTASVCAVCADDI